MYSYYMITIHAHSKTRNVLKSELKAALHMLHLEISHMKEVNLVFEKRSNRQLHLHSIVRTPARIYFKPYTLYDGLQIHWYRIKDQTDLHLHQIYLAKDQYNKLSVADLAR